MPELPEVETVRRGLAPFLEGARIEAVRLTRADLRFPFPPGFAAALSGATIVALERRAKYLLFNLSTGLVWLSHLGMTGSFTVVGAERQATTRYYPAPLDERHAHVHVALVHPDRGPFGLTYSDARRFGFMDLFAAAQGSPFLRDLGPEPFSPAFNAQALAARFEGRAVPVKSALLDQRVVAGLGNIYASEALHRARIRPDAPAGRLVRKRGGPAPRLVALVEGVRTVLDEALGQGGSTFRDFRDAEGGTGSFQHRFAVYDREGEPCPRQGCTGVVQRIVQAGRSSFFCPVCQRA